MNCIRPSYLLLEDLGIDEALAAQIGLRVLKLGMSWPLDREVVRDFAEGLEEVLIVEEKRRCDGGKITAWWPVFRLAWTLITSDGEVEVGGVLGPDEVICDLCNAEVTIRPVPVLNGYAHCAACFASLGVAFPGRVHPFRQAHRHEYSRWQGRPYCVFSSEEDNP